MSDQKKADFKKKFAGLKKASGSGDGLPKLNPCRVKVTNVSCPDGPKFVDSQILLAGNSSIPYGETNPFLAPIEKAEYLTPVSSTSKRVLSIHLNIDGYNFQYEPGDYLCVVCTNPNDLIENIAKRLQLNLNDIVHVEKCDDIPESEGFPTHIRTPCSIRHLFTNYCDFTVAPTKKFLRMLGDYSSGEDKDKLLHLAGTSGRDDYIKFINSHPSFLDILQTYPTCSPPLAYVLDLLPPLTARDYSISSSPLVSKTTVSLLFSVVEFLDTSNKLVKGICTNWLESQVLRRFPLLSKDIATQVSTHDTKLEDTLSQLSLDEISVKIPIFHKSGSFHLPQEISQPLILVGPGSGIAPFLGFVDHRHHQKISGQNIGPIYLFFGCRLSSMDYVPTRNHLSKLVEDGTITKFECAYSRDNDEEIVYVQHKLVERGEEVYKLMSQDNAQFFVCGDAKGMAQGVRDAIITVLKSHNPNMTDKEAMEVMASWSKDKRYILDVWF